MTKIDKFLIKANQIYFCLYSFLNCCYVNIVDNYGLEFLQAMLVLYSLGFVKQNHVKLRLNYSHCQ